jgi:hypothetical protein
VTAGSGTPNRGTERLLGDCAAMGRMLAPERPSARERLEQQLGARLTRELVTELRRRPRGNGR